MDHSLTTVIRNIVREELARALKASRPQDCDCTSSPRRYLNSDEAAKYCGYRGGGQTMRDLKQKDPELPWHKLGRILIFDPAELDAWLEMRKVRAPVASSTHSSDHTYIK